MKALQEIIWIKIVGPLWFERNDIKHDKTVANNKREAETLNNRMTCMVVPLGTNERKTERGHGINEKYR